MSCRVILHDILFNITKFVLFFFFRLDVCYNKCYNYFNCVDKDF